MAGWNGVYTKKGLTLLAKLSDGGSLDITRAVSGTGVVAEEELINQTAVTGIKQELSFQPPSYPESNVCKLPVVLTNKGLGAEYTAHQIGIYAKDPDVGEILYFITQSEVGTNIVRENDIKGYTATWIFYFNYGQADNVNVTVDPSNAVTIDMLEEVRILAERGVSTAKSGAVPIVMENTAALPFAGLKVYGKSIQNGIPSLNVPVEIANVGNDGNMTVEVYGKNLLRKLTNASFDGITITVDGDGVAVANGTATAQFNYSITNRITNIFGGYKLTGAPSGFGSNCCLIVGYYNDNGWMNEEYDTGNGLTIKDASYAPYFSISILIRKDITVNNVVFKPMLSKAGGEYELNKKQSLELIVPSGLPGLPVTSGGNYTDALGQQWICDEIDLARGVYVKRVGQHIFYGAEDEGWRVDNSKDSTKKRMVTGAIQDSVVPTENNQIANILCNRFLKARADDTYSLVERISVDDLGRLHIYSSTYNTNADDWKTFLSANSMTVLYELATPIESKLSINELTAYNPTTTVLNDSDAEMTVDCIRDVNEAAFEMVLGRSSDSTTNNQTAFPVTGSSFYPVNGAEYRIDTAITGTYSFVWPDSPFEFWARFTLGNTFNLTFPSGTKYLGAAPSFEAGCTYEMSVKDGVVIVQQVVSE